MEPVLSSEVLRFRDEVRAFLAAEADAIAPLQFFRGRGGATRALYRRLGERGWLSLTWPVEHGGRAAPIPYEFVLWDEMAYARAARPDLGPGIVAKCLIDYGSQEQKQRLLPGIARGERVFSLGYSEPEAGSDLTGLRTRAERRGDVYVVRGDKCWTSDAHHADCLWLLCRTGPADSRARGLSLLVLDLHAPGVTVRPIETIDGHQLNQVFLDDVRVPVADRVGDENGAWRIIRESLAVERHLMLLPGRVRRDFEDLAALLRESGLSGDRLARQRLAALAADVALVETNSLATLAELMAGGDAVLPAARTKLLGTELSQAIARTAVELLPERALEEGNVFEFLTRQTVMETVAGGTSEVMRGIVAREALGLGARR